MQSNIQTGEVVFKSGGDYYGKEGLVVALANGSGKPVVTLPLDSTYIPLFVLTDCNKGEGANVSCLPLAGTHNVRVRLKGTCTPGSRLVTAAPGTGSVDAGKVEALPSDAGTYRVVGIAEEAGVDGQLVLLRPYNETVTVASNG